MQSYEKFADVCQRRSRYHDPFRSGFQSSVHDQYRSNAQAYDKSLLQKLDTRRGTDNTTPPKGYSRSIFSSSASDSSPTTRIALESRYPPPLKPLSLPIITGRPPLVESPLSRWADSPLSSAISPTNSHSRFGMQLQQDYRSSSDGADLQYARRPDSSSAMDLCDDTCSITSRSRDSYDPRVSPDQDVDFQMEEAGLRRLHLEDYSPRPDGYSPGATTGQKRRASSPPGDEGPSLHNVGSASDLFRQRGSGSRTSPGPRFHSSSGSISSTASGARCSSYASTVLSVGASSMTSMNSYGRVSPGGLSPVPTDGSDSPYVPSLSLNPSPRGSVPRTNHNRTLSESRTIMTSRKMPDSIGQAKHNGGPKIQGVYICECCPKKPKRFDSPEDLKYIPIISC
jgi:hypothetical protein